MDAPLAVFVHGAGAAGSAAWPRQRDDVRFDGSVFLTRPGFGDGEAPRATDWIAERDAVLHAVGPGAHVVAFSYGGLAALLAAAEHPGRIRSLCLIEPPAFSAARGEPAVEAHIAAIGPVMARRDELDSADFVVALLAALGVGDVPRPRTHQELLAAERWRLTAPPWEAPIPTTAVSVVPTLVLTGGWNAEYDATAEALARAGASRTAIAGAGHRVQDHPAFTGHLLAFWRQLD